MWFLLLIGFFPTLLLAFDSKMLTEIASYTTMKNTDILAVQDERLIFISASPIGSFDYFKDDTGHRYFDYQPAQQGNGSVTAYRFPELLDRAAIKEKKVVPTRITYLQNLWKSLVFRTFEVASDGKSLSAYQECWQIEASPKAQCAIANKAICERVNRGNYDWDKNYRKDAQSYRQQMKDRFKAEVLPDLLNEKLALSFNKYEILEDYDNKPKEIINAFASGVKIRIEKVCKSFTWSEESALEAGFKH